MNFRRARDVERSVGEALPARCIPSEEIRMFDALIELLPAEWRAAATVLTAPLRWIPEWQGLLLGSITSGSSAIAVVVATVTLLVPALLLVAGTWCTMLSLYTLPFRSGRGGFITSLLMAWWDAGRCIWLFWTGMIRVGVALVGWVLGILRFGVLFVRNVLLGLLRSPLTALDWTSRRYFQPGVPWIAFLVLVIWSAVEATIFTFTLQPTLNEVFAGLTGFEPNPNVMVPLLWLFLFMLVAGSFACVQVLTEAIMNRKIGAILQMIVVESAVMFFEVIFLYRELIDAITPWIAQQSGGTLQLGITATLLLGTFGWLGVRGMSWFLFGRFGTPALLAILSRQTITQDGAVMEFKPPVEPEMWRAPVNALKAETQWFHEEAKRMFELLSLPVLQLLAVALNFAVITVQSRPMFVLPFRTLEDMMASMPLGVARETRLERGAWTPGIHTPRDQKAAS
ncbi:MAG TPA: hypothetical protein VK575_10000 [Gemmatimonadaceae bacterium]|nr:hypothetical protein [Gemmatimonadaceae bacterium]